MKGFLRDNSLTIVVIVLFVVFLIGQAVTGFEVYLANLAQTGRAPISIIDYLASGHFIEATFENWESEFLQMGALVVLSVMLYQRGSPESKDPDRDEAVDREADPRRPGAPWPVRVGGLTRRVYEHSLAIALFTLFGISLVLHLLGGTEEYNREQLATGGEPVTAMGFLLTADFWFQSFQNWQSEFLSVGALVLLTVFLRERGSPESKPVDEANDTTGSSEQSATRA
jgi:hypothetical protein